MTWIFGPVVHPDHTQGGPNNKLGREYLNALTCKLYAFSIDKNSETFDESRAFCPINRHKVISSQKQSGF